MDKYFDYEDIKEDKKVKHVVTRIKGHAELWWDELQANRRCKGKQRIKIWDRMVAKMKAKFIPRYYQINLFRRLHNLKQNGMKVKEYTEEFYRLNIRASHNESDDEKVSRYMNGLRYEIQDEMSMVTIKNVEYSYQIASKAEVKLARKNGQSGRGRSPRRGKEIFHDRVQKPKDEENKPHNHPERGGSSEGGQYVDRNTFPRERERGRGRGDEIKCFVYGNIRHKYFEFPDRKGDGVGEAHMSEVQR
jgi:hypothetical protein